MHNNTAADADVEAGRHRRTSRFCDGPSSQESTSDEEDDDENFYEESLEAPLLVASTSGNGSGGAGAANVGAADTSSGAPLVHGRAVDVVDEEEEDEEDTSASTAHSFPRQEHYGAVQNAGNAADDGGNREHAEARSARRRERHFPKEPEKALITGGFLLLAGIANDIVLSWVHERLPSQPPLPDLAYDVLPYIGKALTWTEYIMLSLFASLLLLIAFHRHRFIVLRRLFMHGALLYAGRCITMSVTVVPLADPNYYCSPKLGENATLWRVILRGLSVAAGGGLSIVGRHTLCGDYIYSGHTVVLVTSALFFNEYSPRSWKIAHLLTWVAAAAGVLFLLISRGHYTIDIIISYWLCTRVFWLYHTIAVTPALKVPTSQNHLSRSAWHWAFRYLERNVHRPVPHRFHAPVPKRVGRWARRLRASRWLAPAARTS